MLVLQHNGTEPLQLALLLPVYKYLITILHLLFDVGNQEFEVFVENGLRSYGKGNSLYIGLA